MPSSISVTGVGISSFPTGIVSDMQDIGGVIAGGPHDVFSSRAGPTVALPSRVVLSMERLGQ